jgi:diguanylate cyclase
MRDVLAAGSDGSDTIRDGARLAALRELGLLDTVGDVSFDRLTRLATTILGVPVSLVSLVDADRQFFVSQQGLQDEWARFRQTPLSHSFCQYAVATKRPLVVSDAREHPLVADNLAIRDLGVIAYAGMPLILDDGHAVGAFCAIDSQPREWTEVELSVLEDLAATVKELLDLRAALAQEGLYDRLTGLPNRALLVAHSEQYLQQRSGRGTLVVMCAGIDDFTQINQALGTDRADLVLRAVGQRLTESLRSADVLGRLRGDMFTILASNVEDEREALTLAGRIRSALSAGPLQIGADSLSVTATIGIAIAHETSRGADLISEAANAMRQAKRHHTRARVAEAEWGELAASRLRLREALRGALGRGEITAVFQPIVELETGRIHAYETLARWHHPELGNVSPVEFIPAAEATADIIPIGEWILTHACEQLAQWRLTSSADLKMTVNLAPLQLEQPNLAAIVQTIMRDAGVPGDALVLEITEGVLLESAGVQQHNLAALRQLGIRIALDDFGTGYSALGYLKRFPIDIIKIDRSFITGIEDQRYDTALIQAILAMAKGMDLEIIAEGIETPSQNKLLRLLGARYGQGYLFSKPLPAAQNTPTQIY